MRECEAMKESERLSHGCFVLRDDGRLSGKQGRLLSCEIDDGVVGRKRSAVEGEALREQQTE